MIEAISPPDILKRTLIQRATARMSEDERRAVLPQLAPWRTRLASTGSFFRVLTVGIKDRLLDVETHQFVSSVPGLATSITVLLPPSPAIVLVVKPPTLSSLAVDLISVIRIIVRARPRHPR